MSVPTAAGRRFSIGKYEIIATPIPNSRHMLRYTVYAGGRRLGALASAPTESDCRFLEDPPPVPPLKVFTVLYRPGRPKKNAPPRVYEAAVAPREELPSDMGLPSASEER
jgi:hypothetical protein